MNHSRHRPSRATILLSVLLLGAATGALAQNAGSVASGDSLDNVIATPPAPASPNTSGAPSPTGPAPAAFMPKGARPAQPAQAEAPVPQGGPTTSQAAAPSPMGMPMPMGASTPNPMQQGAVSASQPTAAAQPAPGVTRPQAPSGLSGIPAGFAGPQPVPSQPLPRVVGAPTGTPQSPMPIPTSAPAAQPNGQSPFAPPGAALPTAADGIDAGSRPVPFMAATDAVMSDEEANRKVESLARQMRVYNEALKVEKVRGDIAKAQTDYKKTADAAAPKPPVAPPPAAAMPPIPTMPPLPMNGKALQSSVGLRKGQVTTLSITGPRDDLKAMVRLDGVGDMQIHKGSVLPGDIKVVSVEPRGVSVRKGSSDLVLVPFAE